MRPRALDLYCRAGGVSQGLVDAGFEVVGVDIGDHAKAYNKGPGSSGHAVYVRADALEYPLEGFDLICASPPCQASSSLRHLQKGKEYPQLIPATRERLVASGIPYCIENVPGAPLETSIVLCGSMFGLQTPDGRAELRRHRHFEVSFPLSLRPACRHGYAEESVSVTGTGMGVGGKARWRERRPSLLVAGNGPQVLEWSETRKRRKERDERRVITVTGDRPNAANTPRKVITVVGQKGLPGVSDARKVLCVAGGKAMSGGMMTPQGELKRRALSAVGNTAETKLPGWTGRRAVSITGNTAQTNLERNTLRETFSIDDARAAMGISWMAMKDLSQAVPPVYAEFLGRLFLGELPVHLLAAGACQVSLF